MTVKILVKAGALAEAKLVYNKFQPEVPKEIFDQIKDVQPLVLQESVD